MFSAIRTHLSYANVAATMALVFALTGGAFAATSHPGGGWAGSKASASVTPVASTAKKKAAPKSTRGSPRPRALPARQGRLVRPGGATGPAGGTGPQGPQGSAGNNATNGEKGEPGTSVTSEKVKKGEAMCEKEGGSKFTSASGTTPACNGKEGSPWTAGGTLPPETTVTGAGHTGKYQRLRPVGGSS